MSWASNTIASSTCHGTLTLGGVLMNTTTWATLNNYKLWPAPSRRGENLLVPGRAGRIVHPKRIEETSVSLEGLIIGAGGSSAALSTNWMSLYSSLIGLVDSTVTASLVMPHGATVTGTVQITEPELGETGTTGALTFTLDLVLPNGGLS